MTGTITLTSGQIQISGAVTIIGPGAANLTIDGNANNRIFSIFATDPACPALDGADYLVSISGLRLTNARRTQSNGGGAIFSEHSLALDSVTIDNSTAANWCRHLRPIAIRGAVIDDHQLAVPEQQGATDRPQRHERLGRRVGCLREMFERAYVARDGQHFGKRLQRQSGAADDSQRVGRGHRISTTSRDITITDTRIVNNQVIVPNPPVGTQIYRSGGIHAHAKSLNIERSEISDNSLVDATASDLTRGGGGVFFNNASDLQGPADAMNGKDRQFHDFGQLVSRHRRRAARIRQRCHGNRQFDGQQQFGAADTHGRHHRVHGPTSPPTASNATPPTLTLVSTVLANNSSDGGDFVASVTTIPTFTLNATNSLIQKICRDPTCGVVTVVGAGNLLGVDPMLAPLANNGGPTRTQALLTGSPAINAGSNPLALTTDQRGVGFPARHRRDGGHGRLRVQHRRRRCSPVRSRAACMAPPVPSICR